jgi:hypothetical protein
MASGHARLIGIEVQVMQSEAMRRLDVEHSELMREQGGIARALH